ncbi:MAG: hypothetical protein MAG453_01484 [Calditrichaeota bacterium]|nr:hypothetical protein [Calditrichota bacterium]
MDDKLRANIETTAELWKRFWGGNLHSLHLYGSLARGDWARKSSDVNLLLVLNEHDYGRWEDASALVRRKQRKGFATPLMLTLRYIRSSLDVYPIELLDIKLFHETLSGEDPFAGLEINPKHLRLQAEREIKGKWVALREAALELGGNTPAMRDLLAMSVPTWAAVFQALIVIDGGEAPADKREVLRRGAELAGLDADVFARLAKLRRERTSLNRRASWALLKETLVQLDKLAAYADTLTVSV